MKKIQYLRRLLGNLSENTGLPLKDANSSTYTAQSFVPKERKVIPDTRRLESVKDAFVRKIRETMQMQGAHPVFKERGPGLIRVVTALETALRLFPDDLDIEDIIDELLGTAKLLYLNAGDPVSLTYCYLRLLLTDISGYVATVACTGILRFLPSSVHKRSPTPISYIRPLGRNATAGRQNNYQG
jgi:hypothetical protein